MLTYVHENVQSFLLVRMCVEGYLQNRNRHMMECVVVVFNKDKEVCVRHVISFQSQWNVLAIVIDKYN